MCRIATWNVRSIKNKEMEHYNIDVLGLRETMARGNGFKVTDGAIWLCVLWSDRRERAKRDVVIIVAER